MECKTCDTKMTFTSDGVATVFWCSNCGTLCTEVYNPNEKSVKHIWDVPNVSKAKGYRGRLDGGT